MITCIIKYIASLQVFKQSSHIAGNYNPSKVCLLLVTIIRLVGKGENIWDTFTHEGGNVLQNDTGDVACDSYYKYKEDVALMHEMGV